MKKFKRILCVILASFFVLTLFACNDAENETVETREKTEKKENMTESHRLFGVLKENKRVIFETFVTNVKDYKNMKSCLVKEALAKGYNPSDIQLLSEKKIIR